MLRGMRVRSGDHRLPRAGRGGRTGGRRNAAGDPRRIRHRLGELALDGFPGTLLPNPLVRELSALAREAGAELPWVEELAADIFMGRFSAKFLRAAHLAGELLAGSLYARYYDIDYAALPVPDEPGKRGSSSAAFDALCRSRAGAPRGHGPVAANGMVIEQAQILTTHNLATLAHAVGVTPPAGGRRRPGAPSPPCCGSPPGSTAIPARCR